MDFIGSLDNLSINHQFAISLGRRSTSAPALDVPCVRSRVQGLGSTRLVLATSNPERGLPERSATYTCHCTHSRPRLGPCSVKSCLADVSPQSA